MILVSMISHSDCLLHAKLVWFFQVVSYLSCFSMIVRSMFACWRRRYGVDKNEECASFDFKLVLVTRRHFGCLLLACMQS